MASKDVVPEASPKEPESEPQVQTDEEKKKRKQRKKFQREALEAHNNYRAKHGAPPLKLKRELTEIAQRWVDHLVAQKSYDHSKKEDRKCSKGPTGENLYNCRNKREIKLDGAVPVNSWYAEIKDYDFTKPGFGMNTGHFTQLVWKETTELGIAFETFRDGDRNKMIVVANYFPVGNMEGSFEEHVKPPLKE